MERSVESDVVSGESKEGPMEKIKIEQHSLGGMLWFAAWLFTLGFLHLGFWKGVLAIFLWPYYIGTAVSALLQL
jgi:hypothetical protein